MHQQSLRSPAVQKAVQIFQAHGGSMRMADAIRAGVHRRILYALRDAGLVEQLSRGLYHLAADPPLENPDLVTVAKRVPRGVICLISALAFHELTTQIPHEVYVAVRRASEPPRIDYPPVRVFRFSDQAFAAGVEIYQIDRAPVRIYSREKTLADCFKFRNKVGLDTAVEALKEYKKQGRIHVEALLEYGQLCRVAKVMRPYLEAIL
jgi:predicted transcriptional regulator of viral defense system